MYELLTRDFLFAWCVSAAVLLIEHAICRPRLTPFWKRYALGVLALLAGAFAYEYVSGTRAGAVILAGIATTGILVILLYAFDARYKADLSAAKESGEIEGRAIEAARRAGQTRRPGPRGNG